ncbi:MAG: TonB-dependent receptor [Candidatus Pseudobacter hemicellulosilyticus]|uniref:TonB-dependent receptor n=1 Tax=Candidatus Pseudobacter hemicellulosilyticus TaxID=3121375 RepID=A0AAJ6BGH9_9BACT|nr:MAG: TonB-dependent receptor [Pseudobacter sp.]
MKMSLFFLVIALHVSAKNYAQWPISLKAENVTLADILSRIEKTSPYRFSYSNDLLPSKMAVSVNVVNASLDEVLSKIFEDYPVRWKTIKKTDVVLLPLSKEEPIMLRLERTAEPIKGTVVNEKGEPVAGASVTIKGTANGTATLPDGRFAINADAGDILVISNVGYITQEVTVVAGQPVNVSLKPVEEKLEEVVVVGYGTMRKSDLTGSISTAKGSDIIKGQSFNALEGLKGKAAGVNIFSNTGQPGGEMRVIIRGIATIDASASPLYVVDGVVMQNFQFLNPNDIESIEVLKDASSTAIYGARGANGVILVTTKRGLASGKSGTVMSYAGSVSVGTMAKYMDVMDANEWMAAFKQGLENANQFQGRNFTTDLSKIFTDPDLFNADGTPKYNTDWQKEASRTALSHNHQLNIQRSSDKSSLGAFLNFTDQQGVLLNSYFKRLNAKLAYDDRPTDWLSTGINLLVNHSWGNRTSDNPYSQGALRTMVEQLPFLPVKLANGDYAQTNNIKTTSILRDQNNPASGTQGFSPEGVGNPVELLERVKAIQYRTQIFGNAAFTFHLAKDLELKTQFGIDYQTYRANNYTPFTPRPLINQNSEGTASANTSSTFYWQEETYLTYKKRLGDHSINAMAGASWQGNTYNYFSASDSKYIDDYFGFYNMGKGTNRPSVGSDYDKWTMNSYFFRAAYSYDSKYMATVTGRYDGSSKFGPNNKYGFFPSIGLGWMVSNENFMSNIDAISKLKLHSSLGVTGNSEIGTYASLARVGQSNTIIGNGLRVVSYLSNMPNPNLKWERTTQWDLGVDLGLLNNRINLELSYYYKHTTDLLLSRPLPLSAGFSSVTDNIGAVSNRGVDILVTTYPIQTNDFQWTSTINLGYNKSRVEKLDENASIDPITGKRQITTDGFVGYDILIREGDELSVFYGSKRAGIYDGVPGNWDAKTMNIPNVIGEKVTYKDRQVIGHGLPRWTGSFINTFSYKGFDLTADLQFTWGVKVMQEFFHSTEGRFLTNGLDRLYQDAWHPTLNPTGTAQALRLANFGMGSNANADDTWVADGSYLRGNLFQLGYTFNPGIIKRIGIAGLRVYANANNAFLITSSDYLGYDPDNSSRLGDNKWGANRQFFTYPRPRTFTFGANVTF